MVVIGLKITDGGVLPLAWSKTPLSKREIRSLCKKFLKDSDVVCEWQGDWRRLYSSKQEVKQELPRI